MENKDIEKILEKLNDAPYYFYQDNKYAQPNFQNTRLNCEDDRITRMRENRMKIERLKTREVQGMSISDCIIDMQRKLINAFVDEQFDFAKDHITREEAERFVVHNIDFSDIQLVEKEGQTYIKVKPKLRG